MGGSVFDFKHMSTYGCIHKTVDHLKDFIDYEKKAKISHNL